MKILFLADAAIPLVWFTLPAVILLLIPTVLVEGILLKLWLRISAWRAIKTSLISNVVSTIAGVPLATGLSYLATWAVSPWTQKLLDREHWQSPAGDVVMAIANSSYISAYVVEAPWILPAALLIILVPAYLISWWLEFWITKKLLLKSGDSVEANEYLNAQTINKAVRRANFLSYVFLFIFIATRLVRSQF